MVESSYLTPVVPEGEVLAADLKKSATDNIGIKDIVGVNYE